LHRSLPSATEAGRQVSAERHQSWSSTPPSPHLRAAESTTLMSQHPHRCVLGLLLPHSLRSRLGRCHRCFGLPRPHLRRLDIIGDNLLLVPHHRLAITLSCRRPPSTMVQRRCHARGRCARANAARERAQCAGSGVGSRSAGLHRLLCNHAAMGHPALCQRAAR
jgi:hypothetical protein